MSCVPIEDSEADLSRHLAHRSLCWFCRALAQLLISLFYIVTVCEERLTINFLNIRTPKKFVVITLKYELCGSTKE